MTSVRIQIEALYTCPHCGSYEALDVESAFKHSGYRNTELDININCSSCGENINLTSIEN